MDKFGRRWKSKKIKKQKKWRMKNEKKEEKKNTWKIYRDRVRVEEGVYWGV